MYIEHPAFCPPKDRTAKLWRYQDFPKLAWLLNRRALFFARADCLGDPFEGSYPRLYVDRLRDKKLAEHSAKHSRKWYCVNCWHMAEYESAAMWKLYSHGTNGVAIQTTFDRLVESLEETDREVYVGQVRYIDYECDSFPNDDPHNPMMHKRKAFEHEREVRAVVREHPDKSENGKNDSHESAPHDSKEEGDQPGVIVGVDVAKLIENIYIDPSAPRWQVETIRGTVEKFGIDPRIVQQSELAEPPYLPD